MKELYIRRDHNAGGYYLFDSSLPNVNIYTAYQNNRQIAIPGKVTFSSGEARSLKDLDGYISFLKDIRAHATNAGLVVLED